jgi:hypothetical protein
MISFSCPNCKALLTVGDEEAGTKFACPTCGRMMLVPDPVGALRSGSLAAPSTAPPSDSAVHPGGTLSASSPGAEMRVVNGRPMVFWPCAHCRVGLNTPFENVGLSIQCPSCQRPVAVPNPGVNHSSGGAFTVQAKHRAGGPRAQRRGGLGGLFGAMAAGAVLVAAAAIALLLWQPWSRETGPLSAEQTRFLPDDAEFVSTIDVQGLLASGAYRKVRKAAKAANWNGLEEMETGLQRWAGLGLADILSVTVAGNLTNQDNWVVVVRSKKPIPIAAILTRNHMAYREEKVGGYTVYTVQSGQRPDSTPGFCVADTTLVVGRTAKLLRKVLRRDRKAEFPATLRAALKRADFTKTFALAVGKPPVQVRAKLADLETKIPSFRGLTDKIEGFTLVAQAGEDLTVTPAILCTDAAAAQKVSKALRSLIDTFRGFDFGLDPALKKLLDSLKLPARGSRVTGTITLDVSKFTKLARDFLMPNKGR